MAKHDKNEDVGKEVRQQVGRTHRTAQKSPAVVHEKVYVQRPPVFSQFEREKLRRKVAYISRLGPLYPPRTKGRSKRGWTEVA